MRMKGPLDVRTPVEYIGAVDEKRRPDITALDALIRRPRGRASMPESEV
jgi:hypothetical protein